jgi:hypothetical protein
LSPTFLKQHPEWQKARDLAAKTSTDGFIGHFTIEGWGYADFKGDVVRFIAVENHAELGYELIIGRTTTGWSVLWKNRYRKHPPTTD